MVTLTSGEITVTADTAKAAAILMRQEHKRQEKQRKAESAALKQCTIIAQSRAFNVMRRMMEGEAMPRGFKVYPVSTDPEQLAISSVRAVPTANGVFALTIFDINSTSTVTAYGSEILGVMENGSGEPMLLWIKNRLTDVPDAYAIGCQEGYAVLYPIPNNIRIDLFSMSKKFDD